MEHRHDRQDRLARRKAHGVGHRGDHARAARSSDGCRPRPWDRRSCPTCSTCRRRRSRRAPSTDSRRRPRRSIPRRRPRRAASVCGICAASVSTITFLSDFTLGAIFSTIGMKVRSTNSAWSSAWFMIQAIWSGKQPRVERVVDAAHAHDAVPGFDMARRVPGERADALARLEAVAFQPLRHLQRTGADVAIGGAHDRPFDRARDDLAVAVLARRVIEYLVAKQRPFLHQPQHRVLPELHWTNCAVDVAFVQRFARGTPAAAGTERRTLVGHIAATLDWDMGVGGKCKSDRRYGMDAQSTTELEGRIRHDRIDGE